MSSLPLRENPCFFRLSLTVAGHPVFREDNFVAAVCMLLVLCTHRRSRYRKAAHSTLCHSIWWAVLVHNGDKNSNTARQDTAIHSLSKCTCTNLQNIWIKSVGWIPFSGERHKGT